MQIHETKWIKTWKDGVRVKIYFIPVKANGTDDVAWSLSTVRDDDLIQHGARFLLKLSRTDALMHLQKTLKNYTPVEKTPEEIKEMREKITSKFYGND